MPQLSVTVGSKTSIINVGKTGPRGPGYTFRGTYDPAATYAALDTVTYQGSSYAALGPASGIAPGTNDAIWGIFAQKGAQGDKGVTGDKGDKGDTGDVTPAATAAAQQASASEQNALQYESGASTSAQQASASAQQASASVALAQTAANASAGSARYFATAAAGVAGSADGQSFSTLSADGKYMLVYQRQAGVAQLVAQLSTQAYLDAMIKTFASQDNFINGNPVLGALLDSLGRALWYIKQDGTFLAKLGLASGSGVNVTHNADGTYSFSLGTVTAPLALNTTTVDGAGAAQDYLFAVVDAVQKLLVGVANDGTLYAKLPLLSGSGVAVTRNADGTYTIGLAPGAGTPSQSIGQNVLDSAGVSSDYLYAITDSGGKLLLGIGYDGTIYGKIGTPQELVDARGTATSVNARLSQSMKPYGLPLHYHWGEWFLRETRMRLRKRSYGDAGVQHIIAAIGDSYTQNPARWSGVVQQILAPLYGDAGPGWCGFGNLGGNLPNGNANSTNASYTKTGSWDISVYFGQFSPDLGQVTSSTVGDLIDVTSVANVSLVRLFYLGTGGVISYRWKDLTLNTWSALTTLNLASDGNLNTADLVGQPTNPFRLEFAVVSGTVTLFGVDIQKTTDGIRFHKLGASGSSTINWNNANTAQWLAGLVKLAPSLITILFGTNDQAAMAPSTFQANLTTLVTNIQSVLPYADILMISPPENLLGRPTPMPQYADAMYQVAQAKNCAFLDLQYVFGPANNPQSYGSTSGRPWFNSDNTHPDPPTGGRAMVDAICRTLLNL